MVQLVRVLATKTVDCLVFGTHMEWGRTVSFKLSSEPQAYAHVFLVQLTCLRSDCCIPTIYHSQCCTTIARCTTYYLSSAKLFATPKDL